MFTDDIQQTEALNLASASATNKRAGALRMLDTKRFAWLTRERYFVYRSKEVVKYVMKTGRAIYWMLNVETVLMDAILKFAIVDIPKARLRLLRHSAAAKISYTTPAAVDSNSI